MKSRSRSALAGLAALMLVAAVSLASGSPAQAVGGGVPQGPSLPDGTAREIGHGFSTAGVEYIDFDRFTCTFVVPGLPKTDSGQSVFPWCGVGQSSGVSPTGDTSFGILQPVLMYGGDCVSGMPGVPMGYPADPSYSANPYWYYSAQYVYPQPVGSLDYTCTTGTGFRAEPGDVLVSTFTFDHTADTMTVQVAKEGGSDSSTLTVDHPWDDPASSWATFEGQFTLQIAIEEWSVSLPDGFPASPALWPVAMTYEGTMAAQFHVESWANGKPVVTCDEPAIDGEQASTICTYDFAALQPAPPPTTVAPPPTPVAVAATEATPSFTG